MRVEECAGIAWDERRCRSTATTTTELAERDPRRSSATAVEPAQDELTSPSAIFLSGGIDSSTNAALFAAGRAPSGARPSRSATTPTTPPYHERARRGHGGWPTTVGADHHERIVCAAGPARLPAGAGAAAGRAHRGPGRPSRSTTSPSWRGDSDVFVCAGRAKAPTSCSGATRRGGRMLGLQRATTTCRCRGRVKRAAASQRAAPPERRPPARGTSSCAAAPLGRARSSGAAPSRSPRRQKQSTARRRELRRRAGRPLVVAGDRADAGAASSAQAWEAVALCNWMSYRRPEPAPARAAARCAIDKMSMGASASR